MIALSMRLSRICSTPLGTAPAMTLPLGAVRSSATPAASATADHVSTLSRTTADQIDGHDLGGLLGPRELQQIGDERAQPARLVDRGGDVVGAPRRRRVALQVLKAEAQGGERRAELVRGVRHEGAVLGQKLLETSRHGVHGRSQGGDLGRRSAVWLDRREVAGGEPGRGGVEAAQRPGDGAGDRPADAGHGREHDRGDRRAGPARSDAPRRRRRRCRVSAGRRRTRSPPEAIGTAT